MRDVQTVTPEGESVARLPDGAFFRETKTHVDARGSLWELYDPRWPGVNEAPLTYAYAFTCRPGMIKGWNIHRNHEDRYTMLFGELLIVLYDDRPESPTNGLVTEVGMSEYRRGLLTIPIGVYHAVQNIGTKDSVVVNFPTRLYDHGSPDKYRLPVDTDEIPYTFRTESGW